MARDSRTVVDAGDEVRLRRRTSGSLDVVGGASLVLPAHGRLVAAAVSNGLCVGPVEPVISARHEDDAARVTSVVCRKGAAADLRAVSTPTAGLEEWW